MLFLKITSQTPLICHGDGIITELSAQPSHLTPERINVRNNQNTSPEPTGKHMLIPYSCLQHFSWTHLTSWSRFVIANLKIHLGCSQQESLSRERTVYSVPCLPCMVQPNMVHICSICTCLRPYLFLFPMTARAIAKVTYIFAIQRPTHDNIGNFC